MERIYFFIEEINNGYQIEYKWCKGEYKTVYCKDKKDILSKLEELVQLMVN